MGNLWKKESEDATGKFRRQQHFSNKEPRRKQQGIGFLIFVGTPQGSGNFPS
jgi:hypothetical protein